MSHKILELYSGIGGMHCAWNESNLPGEIVAAVDINTVANEVYKHNFPVTNLMTKNIQSLPTKLFKDLNMDTILMSPPCQPFSRNGNYLDENDPRTKSFLYIISILDELDSVDYILMENVKGFECSTVRDLFVAKLKECKFEFQEYLLCPTTVGVPNSRLRYYCIARRRAGWQLQRTDEIMSTLPKTYEDLYAIETILETSPTEEFLVPAKHLKRANIFDICYKGSKRSCCFTKSYSHYVEGTGSVFSENSPEIVKACIEKANNFKIGSDEYVDCIRDLKLRFFTPKEVLALMAFPKYFSFPKNTTNKQCYRLLGNSVNVRVISELIKLLFDE